MLPASSGDGIADGLALGVCIRVVVLDDTAGTVANDGVAFYQYSTVGLVSP
jgi:hypothetical protein